MENTKRICICTASWEVDITASDTVPQDLNSSLYVIAFLSELATEVYEATYLRGIVIWH